ncbi:hypothetical protein EC991_008274 [Linnemannia zychae]|nr:hypothetical protein EC991_008274 [Linnemannia zychae]
MFKAKRIRPIPEPAGQKPGGLSSPLHIPEILERIFTYIHRHDDLLSALQVCREWYRMNRHLFVREVVVDYELEQPGLFRLSSKASAALANLSTAERLRWYDGFNVMHPRLPGCEQTAEKHVQALVNALRRKHEHYHKRQQQHQQQQVRQKRQVIARLHMDDSPLRHLDIVAGMHFTARFHKLLPFVSSLTRLRMQLEGKTGKISLSDVFKYCPLLELVAIDALSFLVITGLDSPLTGAPLPLRSLSLCNTRLPQQDLENLLSATPRLKELRLINILTDHWTTIQYSVTRLIQSLRDRSIQLSTLHMHKVTDSDMSKVMHEMDYTVTGWSFWAGDLSNSMLTSLRTLRNVVTTLELHFHEEASTGPNSGLHRYLCESPHLLHLRAPKSSIMVEAMDIHARGHILHKGYLEGDNDWEETAHNWSQFLSSVDFGQRQIWACRKLQTLHVSIYSRTEPELLSPARSRIVFGYLSRICPDLQDIQIGTSTQTGRNGLQV